MTKQNKTKKNLKKVSKYVDKTSKKLKILSIL